MVRIGVDASRAVAGQRTGTEFYSFQLIRELIELDREDSFTLYFRSRPGDSDFSLRSGIEARVLEFPRLWTHVRLSWEMATRSPDLLFVPAHVLPVVHPARSVVTVHDLGYLYHRRAHRALDWMYLDLSTRYNSRVATRVIADSEATKEDLISHYGIDGSKISTVHLAHDQRFRPVEDCSIVEEVKRRHGIDGDYLLCLGTIQPRKNLAGTLAAYSIMKRRIGRIVGGKSIKVPKLVMVGRSGWLSQGIYKQVQTLGIADDVIFTGYAGDQDLPAILSGATALVFASLYEGFGLPALEAMACGTPVITSNVSSLPEVVGDAGLLIDPTDNAALAEAMAQVCSDEGLRMRLRERGLKRAGLFSWRRCAEETLRVLRDAAN